MLYEVITQVDCNVDNVLLHLKGVNLEKKTGNNNQQQKQLSASVLCQDPVEERAFGQLNMCFWSQKAH